MKLAIVAVGHRQPDWISAGCSEYLKRLPPEMAARMIEIKPEPRGSKSREQLLAAERSRIDAALPASVRLIVLDEKGAAPRRTARSTLRWTKAWPRRRSRRSPSRV